MADKGLKVIDWASNDNGDPDIVIAAAGTEPNLESLAAISILRKEKPELKIRFVNVVDLLKLRSPEIDPRGLTDEEFNEIFTINKPVLFAFHGFEDIIKDIFFDRDNHNLFVHGYRENGDITTPFDMRVVNEMDRFHLAEVAAVAVQGWSKRLADEGAWLISTSTSVNTVTIYQKLITEMVESSLKRSNAETF